LQKWIDVPVNFVRDFVRDLDQSILMSSDEEEEAVQVKSQRSA
jgi:hypothetical protein